MITISVVFPDKRGGAYPYCFTTGHKTTQGHIIQYHRYATPGEAETDRATLIGIGYTPVTERNFSAA